MIREPRDFFLQSLTLAPQPHGWLCRIENRIILSDRALLCRSDSYAPGRSPWSVARVVWHAWRAAVRNHRDLTRNEHNPAYAAKFASANLLTSPSSGWFKHQEPLAALIKQHNVRSVLEVGSFLGESAIWFAQQPGVERVTCIDRWTETATRRTTNNLVEALELNGLPRLFHGMFLMNLANAGVLERVTSLVGDSKDPAVVAAAPVADLVYLDGDHSDAGVLADLQNYGPKAAKVLCGDDYDDNPEFGVRRQVDRLFPGHGVGGDGGHFWWEVKR